MNSLNEVFEDQLIRLKISLDIYSQIQYNESKLFNLLALEIESIKEINQHSERKTKVINRMLKRSKYPRELIIEPLLKEPKIEQFTMTTWSQYCFMIGLNGRN